MASTSPRGKSCPRVKMAVASSRKKKGKKFQAQLMKINIKNCSDVVGSDPVFNSSELRHSEFLL